MAGNDSNTISLLHFDGTNASTTIADVAIGAGTPMVWTAAGSAQLSTTSPKFGTASLTLSSATSDKISTPSNALFNALGTTPFVVDCWIKTSTTGTVKYIVGVANSTATASSESFALRTSTSNQVIFEVASGSTIVTATSSATVTDGAWHHIAGIADGTKIYVAVDGSVSAGVAYSSLNATTNVLSVGALGAYTSQMFTGNVDEFRFSSGTTRGWTTNFTPPTSAYTALYTLAVAAASYALVGIATTVKSIRHLNPLPATFLLTGVPAGVGHVYRIMAVTANFVMTGVSFVISDQVAPASKFALRRSSPTLSKLRTSDPTLEQ